MERIIMDAQQLVDFVLEDLEFSCQGGDLDPESNGFEAYNSLLETSKDNDPEFYEKILAVNRSEFSKLYEKSLEELIRAEEEQRTFDEEWEKERGKVAEWAKLVRRDIENRWKAKNHT